MKFNLITVPVIEQVNSSNGRYYVTPEGRKLPSVTTVLGWEKNSALQEWRDRVGEQEADKISRKAATRGTLIHESIESYLKGLQPQFTWIQQKEKAMFMGVIPYLDNITEIIAMETRMWSDTLGVAGTVDLIAYHNNKLKIIDWKTSTRFKTADEISNYFMQAACYSVMLYERTGIATGDLEIVIINEEFSEPAVYSEKTKTWIKSFKELKSNYDKQVRPDLH